jgi:hypothetical protein
MRWIGEHVLPEVFGLVVQTVRVSSCPSFGPAASSPHLRALLVLPSDKIYARENASVNFPCQGY